jgi:non-lysosomal glucosylceramidase
MFFRDGRGRQWEALDCPDIDSVHNDYQRHLLYLWLMPQFEVSKMRAWSTVGQDPDGHIVENIASFSLGPIDQPGGRVMADTSSVFVLELLELWRHTGDGALLAELWPAAARATAWMIGNAAALGLPLHLVCTYDMLGIESHNVTTYNSFLFLAAMRAASTLAALLGDAPTQALADAAFARGQAAIEALLFVPVDGKGGGGYFRAFQGGAPGNESAVMADCAYGQMIALQLGLGWLVRKEMLVSHLPVELAGNLTRFGLRVMSDPGAAPTGDTNWMNGVATWSYLSLALLAEAVAGPPPAAAIAAALDPTMRVAENYRSRLNDLWDLHGLTTGENAGDPENVVGQPFITRCVPHARTCKCPTCARPHLPPPRPSTACLPFLPPPPPLAATMDSS